MKCHQLWQRCAGGRHPFFALALCHRGGPCCIFMLFQVSSIDYAIPSSIHVTLLVVCCFCASPYPPARCVLRTSAVQFLAGGGVRAASLLAVPAAFEAVGAERSRGRPRRCPRRRGGCRRQRSAQLEGARASPSASQRWQGDSEVSVSSCGFRFLRNEVV